MQAKSLAELSRRERQIMDIIYRRGEASAAEVLTALPDPPTYSAVRALLRILEAKGRLRHREEGPRYVYLPTQARANAGRQAIHRVMQTFFDGSLEKAMAALLDASTAKVSAEELARLQALIQRSKKEGR
jgi:predicted transcriptional regulator